MMTVPSYESLIAGGLDHAMATSVLETLRDGHPVEVKVYWMYDCHFFQRLDGGTLDEIIAQASEIQKEDGYGMLCSPILLNAKGDEVRRVRGGDGLFGNANAHGRGKDMEYWRAQCATWKSACEADADVMRLLALRTPLSVQRPKELQDHTTNQE